MHDSRGLNLLDFRQRQSQSSGHCPTGGITDMNATVKLERRPTIWFRGCWLSGRNAVWVATLFLVGGGAALLRAQPGSLDPSFNPGAVGPVNAIALQSDGKVL